MLFVLGINVGAWVWDGHFLDHFAEAGFDAHAVSLRGHGRSWGSERIREWTVADYVDDLCEATGRIQGSVVLVGHSLGDAVVQKFVQRGGRAAGMALMASVPPWGLAPSTFRMAARSPRMLVVLLEMSSGQRPTNGQVERMNRTIKDATVKRYHYDTHDQLRAHLQLFVDAYNHARRLKTLRGLTTYEHIFQVWTNEPKRFRLGPSHLIPGPYRRPSSGSGHTPRQGRGYFPSTFGVRLVLRPAQDEARGVVRALP